MTDDNTEQQQQATPPAAIPFWASAILRRLSLAAAAIILRIAAPWLLAKTGIDVTALGITTDEIAGGLDAAALALIGWAAHARVSLPMPQVTGTKAAAQALNVSSQAPPAPPAQPGASDVSTH